jgi:hypothetical protein
MAPEDATMSEEKHPGFGQSIVYVETPEERDAYQAQELLQRVTREIHGVENLSDVIIAREGHSFAVLTAMQAPIIEHQLGGWPLVNACREVESERPAEGFHVLCLCILPERVALFWVPVGPLAQPRVSLLQ